MSFRGFIVAISVRVGKNCKPDSVNPMRSNHSYEGEEVLMRWQSQEQEVERNPWETNRK
jgi:hypothetical protein